MSDIGVAVIGYGLAGAVFHAPLIAATPGLRVRAVVTGSPERRRRAQEDFPDARLPATADELWGDAGDIGLVVVATPNHLHAPQAIAALELGLAVVVDKPLALSTAEAGAMLAAAERTRGLLAVFHNRRWDSDFLLLRELVEQDRLGGLHRLEARFERYRPEVSSGSWRAGATPEQGGGLLLDLGSHLIDQALVLLGRPQTVYGEVASVRSGAIADDDCFLALHFPGGAHAHLWMSDLAPAVGPRWRAWGRAATLEVWGLDPQESQIRAGARPGSPGFGAPDGGQRAMLVTGGEWSGSGGDLPLPAGRAADFYAGMAAAIRGVAPVPVPAEAGVDVLSVVEAARRSSATGTLVAPAWLPPTP
ncbi:MAG: Gfo/Idh/MocA family oxidoreductase [Candidatus Dormibacteria bacterium]